MILTKLIYPRYYKPIYITQKDQEIDFKKMRELNYSEEAISFFEKTNLGYGFTEELDTTINRWLRVLEGKTTIVDIKYQGYADDNSNMSALIIYKNQA